MEAETKRLVKNTAIIGAGNIGIKAVQFLLLPLYTGLLTTEEYGKVDLFTTYGMLVALIFGLRLEQGVYRFLVDVRSDERKVSKLIGNILSIQLLAFVVFFLGGFAFGRVIETEERVLFLLFCILNIFHTFSLQLPRGLGNYKTYAVAGMVNAASTVVSNVFFLVVMNLRAEGLIYGYIVGYLVTIIYIYSNTRIKFDMSSFIVDKNIILPVLKYSIPLIPSEISWYIIRSSDRYVIRFFLGTSAVGLLAVSTKFSVILMEIYSIFNVAWIDTTVVQDYERDSQVYISYVTNTAFKLFSCLMIVEMAVVGFGFDLLISANYIGAYRLIPFYIFSVGIYILISLMSGILIARKMVSDIASGAIISAVINLLFSIILVKRIGILAAPISTCIAYVCMFAYFYNKISKIINIEIDWKYVIILVCVSIVIIALYQFKSPLTSVCCVVIAIIFSSLVNKQVLKRMISFLVNNFRRWKGEK